MEEGKRFMGCVCVITEPLPLGVKKLFLCGKFIMSVSDGEENVISSCPISDFEIWVTFYPHSSPRIFRSVRT